MTALQQWKFLQKWHCSTGITLERKRQDLSHLRTDTMVIQWVPCHLDMSHFSFQNSSLCCFQLQEFPHQTNTEFQRATHLRVIKNFVLKKLKKHFQKMTTLQHL